MPVIVRKRVILLVETHFGYGRSILDGIARYQHTHAAWECWFRPWHHTSLPPDPEAWDGVIGRFRSRADAAPFPSGFPLVNVSTGGIEPLWLPTVGPDEQAIGASAAAAFVERGFRSFAAVGLAARLFANERIQGFQDELARRGFGPASVYRSEQVLLNEEERFIDWLQSRTQPLAIFACNDVTGREVLEIIMKRGLRVPDDVAVIGVDNDLQVCSLSFPQLSSVRTNATQVGFKAAETLARIMDDPSYTPPPRTLVPPVGVVHRLSSDIFAVDDPVVARALAFVRDNLNKDIHVDAVARHVGVSRKSLELKFEHSLSTTPAREIRARRARRALELLVSTRLGMSEIAEKTGVRDQSALSILVKKFAGVSPLAYRKKHQV